MKTSIRTITNRCLFILCYLFLAPYSEGFAHDTDGNNAPIWTEEDELEQKYDAIDLAMDEYCEEQQSEDYSLASVVEEDDTDYNYLGSVQERTGLKDPKNVALIIIGLTIVVSALILLTGAEPTWMYFSAYAVWHMKQYHRLVTYAFVHGSWKHLLFNVLWLLALSMALAQGSAEPYSSAYKLFGGEHGALIFLIYYVGAVIFANIADLLLHNNDPYFAGIGASGAVAALMFTIVLLEPTADIPIFFFELKAWICAILYLGYCFIMALANTDNIGHSAHFCGAIYGFIFPCLLHPHLFVDFFAKIFGLNT